MTVACNSIDPDLGVALRLATFLDCQARSLGEQGFQSIVGGPVAAGLLSGLVTLFVALIGYRLILGGTPGLRDGVTWAVRLGFVLALVTSWPAYQTLVYRVAVDAPGQLAQVILPASGLPSENLDSRVQLAYDTIRLGLEPAAVPLQAGPTGSPAPQTSVAVQGPLPQTASVLVFSTVGVTAALRIAIGFLLAVGPLAVMSLLFDATLGIFSGWLRVLAGASLAVLAATIVTATELLMVEAELARLQTFVAGTSATVDLQAMTTIVLVFALVMLVATLAAVRMASVFRLPALGSRLGDSLAPAVNNGARATMASQPTTVASMATADAATALPSRVSVVADALTRTAHLESLTASTAEEGAHARRHLLLQGSAQSDAPAALVPLGVAGRRAIGRHSLSAARRDRTA